MKLAFRPAETQEERRFVITTWASSFKTSFYAGLIASEDWPRVMHEQIGRVLDRPGMTTLLAFERSDPEYYYGFIAGDVSEPRQVPLVAYVYVKAPYRRAGVARALFAKLGVDPSMPFEYACKTPVVATMHEQKFPRAQWNPLRVRYPKETR